jgi:hypothetical protein
MQVIVGYLIAFHQLPEDGVLVYYVTGKNFSVV